MMSGSAGAQFGIHSAALQCLVLRSGVLCGPHLHLNGRLHKGMTRDCPSPLLETESDISGCFAKTLVAIQMDINYGYRASRVLLLIRSVEDNLLPGRIPEEHGNFSSIERS
ncbi:hypothetical protein L6452_17594 [Arctium lappa]|uniref:Uncharacterized protein n=1 Tax=Arctium lappa TaxID=4217 RepID=A0ACB9C416_ARCLA|nr:hypothetical protein L6452_17594 [Arctium lappa]